MSRGRDTTYLKQGETNHCYKKTKTGSWISSTLTNGRMYSLSSRALSLLISGQIKSLALQFSSYGKRCILSRPPITILMFVYVLLPTLSIAQNLQSRMVGRLMNMKRCGRRRWPPNLRNYSRIFLEGLRKTRKSFQDSRCPGSELSARDLWSMEQEFQPLGRDTGFEEKCSG